MSMDLSTPTTPTTQLPGSTRMRAAAGLSLILIGLLIIAVQLVHVNIPGWLFLGGLGAIFLVWGLVTRTFGLVIPGGVLSGVAMGAFLTELPIDGLSESASGGLFLLGFSLGWALMVLLSPLTSRRIQWWPLIPGGIIGAVGALVLVDGFGLQVLALIGTIWPLVLVAVGVYLLLKRR